MVDIGGRWTTMMSGMNAVCGVYDVRWGLFFLLFCWRG